MKTNCWEKMQCGCQPGGSRTGELGVCPVAVETKAHMTHGGINGGRACWAIARRLADKVVQCKIDHDLGDCIDCAFYAEVRKEEGTSYLPAVKILNLLN